MIPLVSVIIPVYNVAQYLPKCLDSVINQTFNNIEIIIVNDGSTDNSLAIIKEYKQKDNRIVLIHQKNKGSGEARNSGIDIAKCEYLSFIDSDDYVEPTFIEYLYTEIKKRNCDVVQCQYKEIHQNGKKKVIKFHKKNLYIDNNILNSCVRSENLILNCPWNKIFKKQCFNNELRFSKLYFEDYEYTMKLIPKLQSISLITNPLYNYRIREGSITQAYSKKHISDFLQVTKNLSIYYDELSNQEFQDFFKILKNKYLKNHILKYIKRGVDFREYQRLIIDEDHNTLTWKLTLLLHKIRFKFPTITLPFIFIIHHMKNLIKRLSITRY